MKVKCMGALCSEEGMAMARFHGAKAYRTRSLKVKNYEEQSQNISEVQILADYIMHIATI